MVRTTPARSPPAGRNHPRRSSRRAPSRTIPTRAPPGLGRRRDGWGSGRLYAAGGIASARVRLRGEDTYLVPAGNAAPSAGNPPFATPTIGPIVIAAAERRTMTGWTAGIGEQRVASHVSI